jgi:hypothetical protein
VLLCTGARTELRAGIADFATEQQRQKKIAEPNGRNKSQSREVSPAQETDGNKNASSKTVRKTGTDTQRKMDRADRNQESAMQRLNYTRQRKSGRTTPPVGSEDLNEK